MDSQDQLCVTRWLHGEKGGPGRRKPGGSARRRRDEVTRGDVVQWDGLLCSATEQTEACASARVRAGGLNEATRENAHFSLAQRTHQDEEGQGGREGPGPRSRHRALAQGAWTADDSQVDPFYIQTSLHSRNMFWFPGTRAHANGSPSFPVLSHPIYTEAWPPPRGLWPQ